MQPGVSSSSQSPPITKEIPAASPHPPPTSLPEDLYDSRRCTIVLVLQLRPESEAGQPRQVLLSVQNGTANTQDLPLYRLLSLDQLGGPLPPALLDLLRELERQLPERKERQTQRAVASQQVRAPASRSQVATLRKSGAAAAASKPMPPTPTTVTPQQPAESVVFGGIFDGL